MRSAVTISLVPEARGGPFVFWGDLEAGCRQAAELGFDAVEVFPPDAETLEELDADGVLARHGLRLAAVGTGAGWVKHKLRLTDPDRARREPARLFVQSIVEAAGKLGAPAIVGSMQGRWGDGMDRDEAMFYLADALSSLGRFAQSFGVPLLYEPLNRYETNVANTLAEGSRILRTLESANVKLLADLFHMNIEEVDVADAVRTAAADVRHVHFADSNRRAVGCGHADMTRIVRALREIGYDGYLSAEVFPLPDPAAAARQTIDSFRRYVQPQPLNSEP
ncbi:MAG TPA: sugar phosphate isomerase/epimerase family protein [Tepidisphaeraceae bacterium]|nr:sugar phosphate isomerase/epimerase family protein [Tepidisphaeraceae bacterium]